MSLIFSSHPGARERHLQRQYKNPLFTAEQRDFDEQRLSGARYMDEKEEQEFFQGFHQGGFGEAGRGLGKVLFVVQWFELYYFAFAYFR